MHKPTRISSYLFYFLFLLTFSLGACTAGGSSENNPVSTVSPQPSAPPPLPSPTPTPIPRNLVICLGQEPASLYPYNSPSRSAWSILEAVYDGPFDTRQFSAQPVILQKLPTYNDPNTTSITPVDVKSGDQVVNAAGEPVSLKPGTRLFPSGCSDNTCAIEWDGTSALQMDQVALRFTLLPDLKWSDGAPLTAGASVYSFNISSDPATPTSKRLVDLTQTYQAGDDLTVDWIGKPGYLPARPETLFWLPLPSHLWGQYTPAQLLTAEEVNRRPLGWGPYIVDEWVNGESIRLKKNPLYFRSADGLPYFDVLTFRFLGEHADNNIAALLGGECDLVDQTSLLNEQLEPIIEMQRDKKLKAYVGQGPEWEFLQFGIKPAAYDDGYLPFYGDRPDYFGDVRVRQAIAACANRPEIITRLLKDQSSIPVGYLAPSHPLFLADMQAQPYDVAAGSALLDQAGWKDFDNDPLTPRVAAGTLAVPDGTPFTVNYITSEAPLRVEIAKILSESLAQCGIQVNVQTQKTDQFFAAGPAGPLFGRNFDLAQYAWDSGSLPPCIFYESDQIPSEANNWLAVNVGGYSNPQFDSFCQAARSARSDQPAYTENHIQAQRLFASELPVLPLYYRLKLAISRLDFCGMEMDVSARSDLWNIEAFDISDACK